MQGPRTSVAANQTTPATIRITEIKVRFLFNAASLHLKDARSELLRKPVLGTGYRPIGMLGQDTRESWLYQRKQRILLPDRYVSRPRRNLPGR